MEHRFQQLSPHILIMHAEHETDRPVLAAITGERRTLLMDAGNSPGHAELFRQELARRGIKPPELVVLTHWHWDHSFGLSAWQAPVIAHEGTAEALGRLGGRSWSDEELAELVLAGILNEESAQHIRLEYGDAREITVMKPDIVFSSNIDIDLGGVTCELSHVGGDHSADSCFLYIREDNVLFLGDALGPSVYGGPRRYSSTGFLKLLGLAYGYNAQWYVESHGVPMSLAEFRADLAPWERLARIVDVFGHNRERVVQELKDYLQLEELPAGLLQGVEYFMAGCK
ncbi:MBL fold metallo-hydrolase [Paenibacillus jilunlii]|uniref:Glyoxylase, beta-lactamase superfamily II n=1 Tax=Paenibacillus jilunlii TaxID=682956 RepID=A0A1G9U6X4_9BACL|nr:MBL fold metallo-hydrolase [Paenibacillus jilunlii]KWX76291.1 hydrolase glyoxylase [Paenibacillus jilunlii]SDM55583.1 Glyoxylase, beta-lactamase superfamily II [Paenibacillus jilunlii]